MRHNTVYSPLLSVRSSKSSDRNRRLATFVSIVSVTWKRVGTEVKQRNFWATQVKRKGALFPFWYFLTPPNLYLPENMGKTTQTECKKSTWGWHASLKNVFKVRTRSWRTYGTTGNKSDTSSHKTRRTNCKHFLSIKRGRVGWPLGIL